MNSLDFVFIVETDDPLCAQCHYSYIVTRSLKTGVTSVLQDQPSQEMLGLSAFNHISHIKNQLRFLFHLLGNVWGESVGRPR